MFGTARGRVVVVTSVVLSIFLGSLAQAEPVSSAQALRAASGFLKARTPGVPRPQYTLAAAQNRTANGLQAVTARDGTVLAYVAGLEPTGFVILSADTRVTPVVAYSFLGTFDPVADQASPLYQLVTQDLQLRLQAAHTQGAARTAAHAGAWSSYENNQAADAAAQWWPAENTTTTGGWVQTTWHQLAPYNALCPLDPVDGQRSVVGCAATAMAQVLNYHRRCGATFGATDAYTTYSGVAIDGDSTRYDFPSFSRLNELLVALRLKYSQEEALSDADAATLSLACGFAAYMDYSSVGSGAAPTDVVAALLGKFQLCSAQMTGGLSSQMMHVVQENIINGLPVLLGIRTADGMSGHLIVCDGYNTEGEYHLNFGWTSSRPAPITEAWYRLPAEIPSTLNAVSEAIVNIQAVPASLDVDPARLDFVRAEGQPGTVKHLFVRNNTAESVRVNSISCPAGFTAALGSDGAYSDRLAAFDIKRAGQEMMVNVKFDPATAGGYYGSLAINYSDGKVRYVILQGDAHTGGTEIADSNVSGTWSQAQSPYYVRNDIQVPSGSELVVEPGVQVIFMGHYSLTVGADARLLAQGTAAQPIVFTAGNTELGFAGLRLVSTGDDDVLDYCTITYSRKGVGPLGTSYGTRDLAGGALYLYDCSPTIAHCLLANNVGNYGGAIVCNASNPVIANTVIANNSCMGGVPQAGGIFCTGDSNLEIDNCTIVNNNPGGLYTDASYDTQVTNTIVWGNRDYQVLAYTAVAALSCCDVQGGYDGDGNLDVDPGFFDPTPGIGVDYDGAAANWMLKSSSACINAGSAAADAETDRAGNPRIKSDFIDLGAYENQSDLALITLTPAGQLTAGCVTIDTTGSVTLDIANTGLRDVTITSVDVNDANGVFAVVGANAGKVLVPGESTQVEIGFAPTAEKVFTGTIHVRSTADNAADRQLTVSGTGTAGTSVSGSVSGTWTKAKSPYTVTGDLSIARNKTLTIEPGVAVRFAGAFSFTVGYRATLKAVGTEQEPIVFTSTNTTEGWRGLRFINAGSDDVLRYCTIEYAIKPYTGANDWTNLMGGAILCGEGTSAAEGTLTPSSPTIDHCRISHCQSIEGAAICCIDESKAIITNNVLSDNTADAYGGAIFCYYYAEPTITNNVIACNSAGYGGGIYNYVSFPTIANNTIVHNRGAGLYLEATYYNYFATHNSSVVNNIVWENEIYVDSYVDADEYDIRFNDIQGGCSGTGNIDVDPLFADSAHQDYHLKSQAGRWDALTSTWAGDSVTSPCIDAGDPATAVGNEPSPHGGRINMGTYGGTAQASKSQGQI